ncbi:NFX1-type zinc finger-containing protein 1 [Orchesella cincta]|uniref:NFX1-type zinc finger-containing protein 1 n=1 Tax=Orchesella cincta TaxID=48709 RepID=A0A1D2M714_ORCCI|nr:NFX1-type zinc finger-containing protein 1 [Orchesella cincta]
MYIVGNLDSLMRASSTWKQIGAKLEDGGNCGDKLELSCVQHENKTKVSERSHFAPLKLGGCGLNCELILECAHRCPLPCHGKDTPNTLVIKGVRKDVQRSTNVLPNVGRSALHANAVFKIPLWTRAGGSVFCGSTDLQMSVIVTRSCNVS